MACWILWYTGYVLPILSAKINHMFITKLKKEIIHHINMETWCKQFIKALTSATLHLHSTTSSSKKTRLHDKIQIATIKASQNTYTLRNLESWSFAKHNSFLCSTFWMNHELHWTSKLIQGSNTNPRSIHHPQPTTALHSGAALPTLQASDKAKALRMEGQLSWIDDKVSQNLVK